jgi:hypothetical protein
MGWSARRWPRPSAPRPGGALVRWRHQLRFRLIEARLALAAGEAASALAGADALTVDAAPIRAGRYEVQARLVAAAAWATERGGDVGAGGASPAWADGTDRSDGAEGNAFAAAERLLERARNVAGIESWWITADVARAFGVPAWTEMARRQVAALLPRSGRYRER